MTMYKGFDKDLKCRGYQYKIGETYEEPEADLCSRGFHACERPLDVLGYYPPGRQSRYCAVELDQVSPQRDSDSKRVGKKITVNAEIGIPGLVKAQIEYVKAHTTMEYTEPERATAGNRGAATAGDSGAATAGDYGAATAGYGGAATAGNRGAATAGYGGAATAGNYGAATAGNYGAATAGNRGAATAGYGGAATAGNYGAATAGNYGAATAGYRGAATAGDSGAATAGDSGAATAGYGGAATAGNYGAATAGNSGAATSRGSASVGADGVAVARNEHAKVRGGLGALLVCAVESEDNYDIVTWAAVVVDGETIKPGTWYTVKDGEFVEASDDGRD